MSRRRSGRRRASAADLDEQRTGKKAEDVSWAEEMRARGDVQLPDDVELPVGTMLFV